MVCEGQQVGNGDVNNVNLIVFITWTVFMSQRGDESLIFMSQVSDFILVLCSDNCSLIVLLCLNKL